MVRLQIIPQAIGLHLIDGARPRARHRRRDEAVAAFSGMAREAAFGEQRSGKILLRPHFYLGVDFAAPFNGEVLRATAQQHGLRRFRQSWLRVGTNRVFV